MNPCQQLKRRLIGLMTLAGMLLTSAAMAAQPAPFVMGVEANSASFGSKWVAMIYTEAFKRLGVPLLIDNSDTLKRRGIQADEGAIDGEASRVHGYGATHPNLIRVEESVLDLTFGLYTASPTLRLQRLEELPATSLLGEYRRGIGVCENAMKSLFPPERLSDVATEQQGLKKLLAERTDLYCDLEISVQSVLHSPEFKGVTKVRKVIDIGKSVPTYPYLYKKHAELALRLAATLKQMKAEGLIEAYRLQVGRELGWELEH